MTTQSPATNAPDLLPCAFCNSVAQLSQNADENPLRALWWTIGCSDDNCPAYLGVSYERRGDAIKAWNTRATPATPAPPSDTNAAPSVSDAKPKAWVTPLRYGSQVTFYKPPKPADDDDEEWYCYPLFRHPEAERAERARAPASQPAKDAALVALRNLREGVAKQPANVDEPGWLDAIHEADRVLHDADRSQRVYTRDATDDPDMGGEPAAAPAQSAKPAPVTATAGGERWKLASFVMSLFADPDFANSDAEAFEAVKERAVEMGIAEEILQNRFGEDDESEVAYKLAGWVVDAGKDSAIAAEPEQQGGECDECGGVGRYHVTTCSRSLLVKTADAAQQDARGGRVSDARIDAAIADRARESQGDADEYFRVKLPPPRSPDGLSMRQGKVDMARDDGWNSALAEVERMNPPIKKTATAQPASAAGDAVAWLSPSGQIKTNADVRFDGTDTTGWKPLYLHPPAVAQPDSATGGGDLRTAILRIVANASEQVVLADSEDWKVGVRHVLHDLRLALRADWEGEE